MQKNRWPFFFLDGRFESLVTLSLSEASFSSSPSPMCTSCADAVDCVGLCDPSLLRSLLLEADGVSLTSRPGVKGEVGSGRWPASPAAKVLRVGVLAEDSSARISSAAFDSAKNLLVGRGVVGVVSSPGRAWGGSGTGKAVLTAWKLDMFWEEMTARKCVWVGYVVRPSYSEGSGGGGGRVTNSRACTTTGHASATAAGGIRVEG